MKTIHLASRIPLLRRGSFYFPTGKIRAINKETAMFASIFFFILFLPAAILPLGLNTFFSTGDLEEMGVSLESSDDTLPMQGYELVGFLPASNNCSNPDGCIWEFNEQLQINQ